MSNVSEMMATTYYPPKKVAKMARGLKKCVKIKPRVGIVCFSEFETVCESITEKKEFSYSDIPSFPKKVSSQYTGCLTFGKMEKTEVVCLQAKNYENHPFYLRRMVLELMVKIGVKNVIIANTAHGLHSTFKRGDFMIVRDHIDLVSKSTMVDTLPKKKCESTMYNRTYISQARSLLINTTAGTHDGVLACVTDSSYETVAEAKMLQLVGADALGKSTAFEAKICNYYNVQVFSFVLLTRCYTSFNSWTEDKSQQEIGGVCKAREVEVCLMVKSVAEYMNSNGN